MMAYLAEFFREGGTFMFVNLVFLTVALAAIIERTIMVVFRLSLNANAFMAQVQKLILSNNIDRAIKMCNAAPHAALARVIRSGLTRSNRGPREVARALEESVLEVTGLISKRIPALWSIANIATLVGLIGTITGLIRTFRSLGAASPEMKQLMLSKGIAEAMNNTAFGLIIAVSCIVAHMLLHNKAKGLIEEVEFHALRLENMLFERSTGETNPLSRT
jgi:biopolymer transport protein ExbB/TolQ